MQPKPDLTKLVDEGPCRFVAPIQQAFDAIASVLFDARFLTTEFLKNQLPLLAAGISDRRRMASLRPTSMGKYCRIFPCLSRG